MDVFQVIKQYFKYIGGYWKALFLFGFFGFVGILPDFYRFLCLLWDGALCPEEVYGITCTTFEFGRVGCRLIHPQIPLIAGIVAGISVALFFRRLVLRHIQS